jgi:hypothetical protein
MKKSLHLLLLLSLCSATLLANFDKSIGSAGTLIDSRWILTSYLDSEANTVPNTYQINQLIYNVDYAIDDPYGLNLRLLHLVQAVTNTPPVPRAIFSSHSLLWDHFFKENPFIASAVQTDQPRANVLSNFDTAKDLLPRPTINLPYENASGLFTALATIPYNSLRDDFKSKLSTTVKNLGGAAETDKIPIGGGFFTFEKAVKSPAQLLGIRSGLSELAYQKVDQNQKPYSLPTFMLCQKINSWINNTIIQESLNGQNGLKNLKLANSAPPTSTASSSSSSTSTVTKTQEALHPYKFTVTPYQQPGNASDLNYEERVIMWQTNAPDLFQIIFSTDSNYLLDLDTAAIGSINPANQTFIHTARLKDLKFDMKYFYKIYANNNLVFKGSFNTRTKGTKFSFAAFGDGCGGFFNRQANINSNQARNGIKPEQLIAQWLHLIPTDFVTHVGDFVYDEGHLNEFVGKAFPLYNNMKESNDSGYPLMNERPFYVALGDHETTYHKKGGLGAQHPEYLASFYYFDLPRGPLLPPGQFPIHQANNRIEFLNNTIGKYPNMLNYSFDWGNAHFLVLDSNDYIQPNEPALKQWIIKDSLASLNQKWRILITHQPPFYSASKEDGTSLGEGQTKARAFYEVIHGFQNPAYHYDLVLSGHIHNYQITHPITFVPQQPQFDQKIASNDFKALPIVLGPGDPEDNNSTATTTIYTKPQGTIYVITGAGGVETHIFNPSKGAKKPFTRKVISNKPNGESINSFTFVSVDGNKLELLQYGMDGNVQDHVIINK